MPLMIAAIIIIALIAIGLIIWLLLTLRGKDAADLNRYLDSDACQWRPSNPNPTADPDSVYYINGATENQGIEMRVYADAGPADGSLGDDEGICLSIIDPANHNGMILNGFAKPLEAMQFGDGLWNDRFLGDTGIMETMITEKRVAWDQMQQDLIIGHYSMFM